MEMEEEGIITRLSGSIAYIKAAKSGACNKCSTKDACESLSDTEVLVEAENTIGAKVGDKVTFTANAGAILRAGAAVYLLPLIAFIAGVVIGQVYSDMVSSSWNADLVSAIVGFALLIITYVALYFYNKTEDKDTYTPKITRVIGRDTKTVVLKGS
jgi:sigma-E factor negative regulatory protein RseC